GYADKLAAGIVITGGGALLRNLPHLIKFRTGMDVRLGYPSEHLAGNLTQEANHPMYSTCLGLIMLGCEEQTKNKEEVGETVAVENPREEQSENEKFKQPIIQGTKTPGRTIFKSLQEMFSNLFTINDSNM
ncbi:MAG TPA: rod shape-determining protein, partial [Bacteroidales bacterium]|nr:rod shape-determining protein [Bacteroidales bacterium]